MGHNFKIGLVFFVVFAIMAYSAMAEVPLMLNYQGMLTDDLGEPLNDTVKISFVIYDDSTGGTWQCIDTHLEVPVEDGLFNVVIGELNPLPDWLFDDDNRWLQLVVDGDSIKPRTQFVSVPYTYHAKYADTSGYALSGSAIAYGAIDSDGSVMAGTPNITCTWNGIDGRYEITIDGEGYIYDNFATVVTPLGNGSTIRTALTGSVAGDLLVYILDSGGFKVQSRFHFSVFKP